MDDDARDIDGLTDNNAHMNGNLNGIDLDLMPKVKQYRAKLYQLN